MNDNETNEPELSGQRQQRDRQRKERSQASSLLQKQGERLLRKAAQQLLKQGAMAVARTPVGLIIIGIVIFFIIIFIFFFGGGGGGFSTGTSQEDLQPGLPQAPALPLEAASCPIPNGVPSCGSQAFPAAGCGHCSPEYTAQWGCGYDSLRYALDVPAPYGAPVYLPTIGGDTIKWTFLSQDVKSDGRTAIQRYGGTNESTAEQYVLKLHHTAPGTNAFGAIKHSGDVGAQICSAPCEVGSGPHVHIEFAKIDDRGLYRWLDAPLYFCGRTYNL